LPSGFHSNRLGTHIVQALAGQLGAELIKQESTVITHYMLVVPLHFSIVN
jgi:hypothetical protein